MLHRVQQELMLRLCLYLNHICLKISGLFKNRPQEFWCINCHWILNIICTTYDTAGFYTKYFRHLPTPAPTFSAPRALVIISLEGAGVIPVSIT